MYNDTVKSVQDELKGKDKAGKDLKTTATYYNKFKNQDEYKANQTYNRYADIDTFEKYEQRRKTSNDFATLPESDQTYLKQKGYMLEYQETKYAIDNLEREKQRIEYMIAPDSKANLSWEEKAENYTDQGLEFGK